jgi:glycine cleavage system H protein
MLTKGRRHPKTLNYRRCRFVTQLPWDYLYSTDHSWIHRAQGERWRVGLTKFGTRLLGETVEHGFAIGIGAPIVPGQVIGWIEGFKAISDLVCIAQGTFAGPNHALQTDITLLNRDPYGAGWIYEVDGQPDVQCLPVKAYAAFLDQTIDRLRNESDSE